MHSSLSTTIVFLDLCYFRVFRFNGIQHAKQSMYQLLDISFTIICFSEKLLTIIDSVHFLCLGSYCINCNFDQKLMIIYASLIIN